MKGRVRWLAIAPLAALLLAGCVSSGLQALGSADSAQRARAVDTLANAGSQALPQIEKLIEKREYDKYLGAAEVLERIGGGDAVGLLQTMAADTAAPQDARLAALHALTTWDAAGIEPWMSSLILQKRAADALDTAKLLYTQPGDAGARALQALCAEGEEDTRSSALQAMTMGRDVLMPWLGQLAQSGYAKDVAEYAALLADSDVDRAYEAWLLVIRAGVEDAQLQVQAVRAAFALRYYDALEAIFDKEQAQLPESIRSAALACLQPQDLSDRSALWIAQVGAAQGDGYRTDLLAALRAIGMPAYRTLTDAVADAGMQGSAALRALDPKTPEGVLRALGKPAADAVAGLLMGDTGSARLKYFAALLSAFGGDGADARLALLLGSASDEAPGILAAAMQARGDGDGAFGLLRQGAAAAQPQRMMLCAQLLAEGFDARARPVLEPMLLSAEADQRNAAVAAFAKLSGDGAADTLKGYAKAADDDKAQAAMVSLASLADSGSKTLLALAKQADLSQTRRLSAAKALLTMEDGRYVDDIQALLSGATESFRQDLIGALAELKSQAAATAITTAIPLCNQQQRLDIVRVLLSMGDTGTATLNALNAEALKPMAQDVSVLIAEGMQGSETVITNILNAHGTLATANVLLNSGNKTLYAAAEAWGKSNGYKVVTNTAAPSATATAGVAAWGSNAQ